MRVRRILVALSSLTVVAAGLTLTPTASADSVQYQSYQRASQTEACAAQPGETPWQFGWGTDSSWKPSWGQWANAGKGGWTCTRSIIWARTPVAGGTSARTYALGETGPGGGLVFLISGGKTYEMAPKAWGTGGAVDPPDDWCSDIVNSVATGTAVGTGTANTTAMLTNASPFVACTASAANAVRAYPGGGYNDWFLPSKDELNAMWLYSQVGGFNTATYGFDIVDGYWSSSQDTPGYALDQNLGNGGQGAAGKNFALLVRPVRAF